MISILSLLCHLELIIPVFTVFFSFKLLMKLIFGNLVDLWFYFLQVLSANQNGEMKLSVETDMAAVSTHFKDLLNPSS